jgi:hypothetical protein
LLEIKIGWFEVEYFDWGVHPDIPESHCVVFRRSEE